MRRGETRREEKVGSHVLWRRRKAGEKGGDDAAEEGVGAERGSGREQGGTHVNTVADGLG